MNADQVVALVGVCSGAAVGFAGVLAGVVSSGRQLKGAEALAREERRAARVKDAYADLYAWLDAWNHMVTTIAGRVAINEPVLSSDVNLNELRSRAVRGSVTWSKALRDQVEVFEDLASDIVGDLMAEYESSKSSAGWKRDIGQRMKKLDEVLEVIRTQLNSDLDG